MRQDGVNRAAQDYLLPVLGAYPVYHQRPATIATMTRALMGLNRMDVTRDRSTRLRAQRPDLPPGAVPSSNRLTGPLGTSSLATRAAGLSVSACGCLRQTATLSAAT